MKHSDLTPEEEQILTDYESGAFEPVADQQKEIERHAVIAKQTSEKSAQVNIRLSKQDIYRVKAKALEKGIPYQTILSSLIHQYAKGDIRLEL